MQTWYERLNHRRKELHLSQAQLGRSVGVAGATVSDWVHGNMSPRGENLTKLCRLLRVSPDWLLYGKGNPEASTIPDIVPPEPNAVAWDNLADLPAGAYIPVPLYDFKTENGECCTWDTRAATEPMAFRVSWFRARRVRPEDCRAIIFHGDSMAPTVRNGDTVLINLAHTHVEDDGVYAVVWGQDLYIRRLFRLPGGGLELRSDNPRHPNRDVTGDDTRKLRILGEMIWRGG